jgi:adenylosuccinate lyase
MAAVAQGGDRQVLHEKIRQHSHAVTAALKGGADENDLLERLRADAAFARVNFEEVLEARNFVGRAPQQVEEFLEQEIAPIRKQYGHLLQQSAEVTV